MTSTIPVKLRINGEDRELEAAPHKTLLNVLRDDEALTGTRKGCNQGVCGACTVLLDGEPVRSCLSIAANCTGREITTIEGLAANGELTAIQRAMIETGAVQCGFCTSGMVLSAHALLSSNPSPDVDDIRNALSGNLCRCSGYKKIVDAVLHAAKEIHHA